MKSNGKPTQQQLNHRADALNANRGTSGTNVTNAQVNGNRGRQLNPNQIARNNPQAPHPLVSAPLPVKVQSRHKKK